MGSWMYGFIENERGELVLSEISMGDSKYLPKIICNPLSVDEYKKICKSTDEKNMLLNDISFVLDEGRVLTWKKYKKILDSWKPIKYDPKDFMSVDEALTKLRKQK